MFHVNLQGCIGDSLNYWYTKSPKSQGLLAFLLLSLRLTFGQETYLGGPLKRRNVPWGFQGCLKEGLFGDIGYVFCRQALKYFHVSFHFDHMKCI